MEVSASSLRVQRASLPPFLTYEHGCINVLPLRCTSHLGIKGCNFMCLRGTLQLQVPVAFCRVHQVIHELLNERCAGCIQRLHIVESFQLPLQLYELSVI